ncbi:hypothetical protein FHS68_005387, partial [Dyadobacter arcticus]|nr:hypothetical protein [Dyadobacter arcticus]
MNAWHAVGVESAWSPGTHNVKCLSGPEKLSAESWFGTVKFNAQKATLSADPLSGEMHLLNNCAQSSSIKTKQYISIDNSNPIFADADLDASKIYTPDNNLNISKTGVTVHWATGLASEFFESKFNYKGLDGTGNLQIENILGKPEKAFIYPAFDASDKVFYYPISKDETGREDISIQYFFAINHFVNNDLNVLNNNEYPEWEAIRNGLGQIFSLNIKNEYIQTLNPNGSFIWSLKGGSAASPTWEIDFSNPHLSGQPKLYKGINWNYDIPAKNAGILNFWYHLLVHGTDGNMGYQNEKNGTYFVFPIDNELALQVIWKAYNLLQKNSSLEEFRLATHSALKLLMGNNFDPKGKENIALNDAWAAVLGLPDYASTLNHYPADGETVYPWAAKVGVEVEYPEYESARLFEVSKSATFQSSEAPVYQFVNNVAPELATGMAYGLVNLEPGQVYYVRSRLSLSGDLHNGCSVSPDPVLCESLNGKLKWTLTYEFKTEKIPAVTGLNPKTGQEIPAWSSPMSWTSLKGAGGYNLYVIDNDGTVPDQDIPHEAAYDEDEGPAPVSTQLALSRTKKYSWTVAAHHKLGSEWACHVSPTGATTPFTQQEKDA